MKNAYLVRGKSNGIDRVQTFIQEKIAAVSWPELDFDLSRQSKDELMELLMRKSAVQGMKLSGAAGTLDMFVNRLKPGDLVLMPDSNDIYVGRVKSEYFYNPRDLDAGYPHQREVEWVNRTPKSALSEELRSALKAWRTVSNLSHHYEEIEALSKGERPRPTEAEPSSVERRSFSFPLRNDFTVQFEIPADMTSEEARQLRAFFGSQRAYLDELYGTAPAEENN